MIWNQILWLVATICAIWVIYDVWAVQKSKTTGMKVLWTILAIFFSIITAIVYYLMGRK